MLNPRLDTLPPAQQRVWSELGSLPGHFVLYGGTALALRLGHRISEDFDFFTAREFHPDELEREVPLLRASVRLQTAPNTLVVAVDRGGPVKLSFFGGLGLHRVGDPERPAAGGVWVASLLDLVATKVQVVQDRAEAKDYRDIEALLASGISLASALGAARTVYGERFNPVPTLKALCYFADGDLDTLPPATQQKLCDAASKVDLANLPAFAARPGSLLP